MCIDIYTYMHTYARQLGSPSCLLLLHLREEGLLLLLHEAVEVQARGGDALARGEPLGAHGVAGGVEVDDDVEHRRRRVARHPRLLAQVLPQPLRLHVQSRHTRPTYQACADT